MTCSVLQPGNTAVTVTKELGIHLSQFNRLSKKQFNRLNGVDYFES